MNIQRVSARSVYVLMALGVVLVSFLISMATFFWVAIEHSWRTAILGSMGAFFCVLAVGSLMIVLYESVEE